jgi:polyisoprenoid-binding protein YceI
MATQAEERLSRIVDGVEYPPAGNYVLDPAHTRLGFAARHMAVSKVRGGLDRFEGGLVIGEDPLDSSVKVTIDATSVNTRDENRDNHLRCNDFFDVETHPQWSFESTGVRSSGDGEWDIDGGLTIRGVTRPVTLHTVFEGVVRDPYGNVRVGFTAKTSINRDDFGVSFNAVMEAGSLVVGKKVDIEIEAEAVRQA